MHTTQAALLDQHQVLGVRPHSANDVSFPPHWTLYMKEQSDDVAAATAPWNPSSWQTTFASFISHPEPQTPPQDPLKNTSTRPWDIKKKIKKTIKTCDVKDSKRKIGWNNTIIYQSRNKRDTVKVRGSVGGRGGGLSLRWRVPWGGCAPSFSLAISVPFYGRLKLISTVKQGICDQTNARTNYNYFTRPRGISKLANKLAIWLVRYPTMFNNN